MRKYDPELGRFTMPDPLWEKYYGWTPWHYSRNNPLIFKDQTGLSDININVLRTTETENSTTGELLVTNSANSEQLHGYTLELPDRENKTKQSRIKQDSYKAKKTESKKFGEVIRLEDKHNRSAVLIHQGNYPKDTEGCILVGTGKQEDMVTGSKNMKEQIMEYIEKIMQIDKEKGEKTNIRVNVLDPQTVKETYKDK